MAEDFREGTRDHDVSQNIDALLRHIQGAPPFTVLDFGCGPGRDLQTFTRMGHIAVGLDGSERFAQMAREDSGQCCSRISSSWNCPLNALTASLPMRCCSYPQAGTAACAQATAWGAETGWSVVRLQSTGGSQEGWNGPRYGSYHDLDAWQTLLTTAGFVELEHYYRPAGLHPGERQPWLASVWRKA